MEFVRSNGGHVLVKDGNLWTSKNTRNGKTYYNCRARLCTATITLLDIQNKDGPIPANALIRVGRPHSAHILPYGEIANLKFIADVQQRLAVDPSKKPRSAWHDASLADPVTFAALTTTFESSASGLLKYRREFYPPTPHALVDVQVMPGTWGSTSEGEIFHRETNLNERYVLFVSDEGLRILSEAQHLNMDGTFKSRPDTMGINQLFVIIANYRGFNVPCVYCLMSVRTKEAYTAVLTKITELGVAIGLQIQPPLIIMDFERAASEAAQDVWPNCRVRFCNFHFNQSLWRGIVRNRLEDVYKHPQNHPHPDGSACRLRAVFNKIAVLGDLPFQVVGVNFTLYLTHPEVLTEAAAHPTFMTWINYVNTTYMNPGPQFHCYRPVTWNCFNRDRFTRTNNVSEGFNSRFNQDMGHNPEFFRFVAQLKREETHSLGIIQAANGGVAPPPSKKKFVEKDNRLAR
ncbi:uncharacterized protein LOC111709436 [Eurytemora carolleeae]|uniref:uncharacterized protein LOC111709436 n=1 Tax=Eurytemora carolleeae TaxID=1294199 RepID=UPI000C769F77|nr:uncharacterized protein LOC111709436 [Eurytemora carolleeae]|eukprot:XP_023338864.1 uncharacterized protein LOC111709436 [Eurytemora affinis]